MIIFQLKISVLYSKYPAIKHQKKLNKVYLQMVINLTDFCQIYGQKNKSTFSCNLKLTGVCYNIHNKQYGTIYTF